MFSLKYSGFTQDPDLRIVHADVLMKVGLETVVDEPFCVDVGMSALLMSAVGNVSPSRFSDPERHWERMPFFVCGCGDPSCRAQSFRVDHPDSQTVVLTEVEESEGGYYREMADYSVPAEEYRKAAAEAGRAFLRFVESLENRPYRVTENRVRTLLKRLEGNV